MQLTEQDKKRFFAKVKPHENGCHIWQGACNSNGYGVFWLNGKLVAAHRVAYFIATGKELCAGSLIEQIDHICAYHCCVNPNHLRAVSPRENVLSGNTITGRNVAKTHCSNGHEFTPENTRINPGRPTHRECKECQRIKDRKRVRLFRKR